MELLTSAAEVRDARGFLLTAVRRRAIDISRRASGRSWQVSERLYALAVAPTAFNWREELEVLSPAERRAVVSVMNGEPITGANKIAAYRARRALRGLPKTKCWTVKVQA